MFSHQQIQLKTLSFSIVSPQFKSKVYSNIINYLLKLFLSNDVQNSREFTASLISSITRNLALYMYTINEYQATYSSNKSIVVNEDSFGLVRSCVTPQSLCSLKPICFIYTFSCPYFVLFFFGFLVSKSLPQKNQFCQPITASRKGFGSAEG